MGTGSNLGPMGNFTPIPRVYIYMYTYNYEPPVSEASGLKLKGLSKGNTGIYCSSFTSIC